MAVPRLLENDSVDSPISPPNQRDVMKSELGSTSRKTATVHISQSPVANDAPTINEPTIKAKPSTNIQSKKQWGRHEIQTRSTSQQAKKCRTACGNAYDPQK